MGVCPSTLARYVWTFLVPYTYHEPMTNYEIMVMATDDGTVVWCPEVAARPEGEPVDLPLSGGPDGFLFGPPALRERVLDALAEHPDDVLVGPGREPTHFTRNRGTLRDVALAMVVVGGGRGFGNDALWETIGGMADDPDDDAEVEDTTADPHAELRIYAHPESGAVYRGAGASD